MPREDKTNKPHFVRQVPKFLKAYSHMLTTNKKNYLNERVEYDDVKYDNVEAVRNDGAVIVEKSAKKDMRISSDNSDDETKQTDTPVDDSSTKPLQSSVESPSVVEAVNDAPAEDPVQYYKDGKIIFHKKAPKDGERQNTHKRTSEEVSEPSTPPKKQKKKQKLKQNLLSFD
mmetsp:Transcript_16861/g.25370  ORF Transcript_16861/g.25370 Transcript_16861/m.25370 type:complete len:172 (+) Transcript_16861:69-584(+)